MGLFDAIENKKFAEVSRPKNGGKGLEGVVQKSNDYYNPFYTYLENELNIKKQ